MDARTRALAVDFSLAGGALGAGGLWSGGPALWNSAVVLVGCAVLVSRLYLTEQTPLLELVGEYSPLSHLAAFTLTFAVGLVLVLGWVVVDSPAASLLLGMGAGLAAYRFVYGVREPVPDRRLAQYDTLEIEPPR